MLQVVVVGLSYRTAPVELRERFSVAQDELESKLVNLSDEGKVEECLILSTCNRIEVYAVSKDVYSSVEEINGFLAESAGVPTKSLSQCVYVSVGGMAVKHLYRVASGIDSMVIGEPQILGQVKQAYKTSVLRGTAGLILNRLCHSAFFVAKKVRSETGIGSRAVSVSYVAVELAKRIFDDLSKRAVMLIGSGDMAELAAKNLLRSGVGELLIASRNFDHSSSLSRKLNGKPIKYDERLYFLKDVDIVITATGSPDFIIKPSHVRQALKLRRNEPIFMIDIAVPRNIDPRVEELSDIYLYDIDDLKNVLDKNVKTRRADAEKAEEIVSDAEKAFGAWINSLKVVPTIIDLKNRFESIKKTEVERTLVKLGSFTDRDKDAVNLMASRIIDKILHNPLTNLKKEASTSLGALYVDSVKRLFELESKILVVEEEEDELAIQNWN